MLQMLVNFRQFLQQHFVAAGFWCHSLSSRSDFVTQPLNFAKDLRLEFIISLLYGGDCLRYSRDAIAVRLLARLEIQL